MGRKLERSTFYLRPDRIIKTIRRLQVRVDERFPGRGIVRLVRRLHELAVGTADRVERSSRPILLLRLGLGAVLLLGAFALSRLVLSASMPTGVDDLAELIQALEAGLNDVIILGAALFFLFTIETRIKRHRALVAIRELRALAHIVDMHQLDKDPDRFVEQARMDPSTLPAGELERERSDVVQYLDCCAGMMSLISKLAALYAQQIDDPVVLAAVDEVENLTLGLSSKMWQKIMILDQVL